MTSLDDWLNDEEFDFDVTTSPVGDQAGVLLVPESIIDGEVIDDEGDEEVFFGPQTHKERCAAVVVKEQEVRTAPVEPLNHEQQALILRESALLSIRIKHGTPNSTISKESPIAVVHPMLRETSASANSTTQLKEAFKSIKRTNNKENIGLSSIATNIQKRSTMSFPKAIRNPLNSKLSASKHLQLKFSGKNRPSSQPNPSTTKLPISKSRGKLQSDFSEPLVDKTSLYGLHKTQPKGSIVRTRSGAATNSQIPSEQKSKNTSQPPTMLQSAIPSSRLKFPTSGNSQKSSSASDSKPENSVQPMRATGGTVQVPGSSTNLRLSLTAGGARKTASTGTPSKSGNPSCMMSSKRRSFVGGTPNRKSANQETSLYGRKSKITPVQRTPSSRKSIPVRQLIGKNLDSSSRTPSPSERAPSTRTVTKDETKKNIIHSTSQTEISNLIETNDSSNSAHLDILSRYKKLCGTTDNNSQTKTVDKQAVEKSANDHQITTKDSPVASTTCIYATSTVKNTLNIKNISINEAPLLDINTAASPLLKLSPEKKKNLFPDPFHTGATPPPLVDVVDILQPERPNEMNLIEF